MSQRPPAVTRILGVDPGSRITGYGVIDVVSGKPRYVASGCIRTGDGELEQRLARIYAGLADIAGEYRPDRAAIERVFLAKNPDSALKLGQARGAALVSLANQGLSVAEYAARQVKQAVTGQGSADKARIQQMVAVLLHLSATPQEDAADALGIALTHAYAQSGLLPGTGGRRGRRSGGRWRL